MIKDTVKNLKYYIDNVHNRKKTYQEALLKNNNIQNLNAYKIYQELIEENYSKWLKNN